MRKRGTGPGAMWEARLVTGERRLLGAMAAGLVSPLVGFGGMEVVIAARVHGDRTLGAAFDAMTLQVWQFPFAGACAVLLTLMVWQHRCPVRVWLVSFSVGLLAGGAAIGALYGADEVSHGHGSYMTWLADTTLVGVLYLVSGTAGTALAAVASWRPKASRRLY